MPVIDLYGQTLVRESKRLQAGEQRFSLDVNSFPKGVYLVQIELNDQMVVRKVLLQ